MSHTCPDCGNEVRECCDSLLGGSHVVGCPKRTELPEPRLRRFLFHRLRDESGVSGTGVVAEGVQFTDGRVVIHWLAPGNGLAIYDSIEIAEQVHGHHGATLIHWLDREDR